MSPPKLKLKNIIGHLGTINKHKWEVFKCCCHAGIIWRGITHDLTKYSPIEFFSSARYYQDGKSSPVDAEKLDKGYCRGWLHHRGHSPHHSEYWIDGIGGAGTPIKMELQYAIEMICDFIAAGKVYLGKEFTDKQVLNHTTNAINRGLKRFHPKTQEFILAVEKDYGENGNIALKRARQTAEKLGYNEAPNVMDDSLAEIAKKSLDLNKSGT